MMLRDRLKELRKEYALSQKEVAQYLHVATPTYSSWEQGVSEPNLDTVVKLANYYEVSVDYLLGLTDTKEPAERYYYTREELKKLGLSVADLKDYDFLKFTQLMKAENITPEKLKTIIGFIRQLKELE